MAMSLVAASLLADPEDAGKAGPLGLLVIIVLGVACYFLFRSMSRHLRKVQEEFPVGRPSPTSGEPTAPPAPPTPPAPAAGPSGADPSPSSPRSDPGSHRV